MSLGSACTIQIYRTTFNNLKVSKSLLPLSGISVGSYLNYTTKDL